MAKLDKVGLYEPNQYVLTCQGLAAPPCTAQFYRQLLPLIPINYRQLYAGQNKPTEAYIMKYNIVAEHALDLHPRVNLEIIPGVLGMFI